MESKNLLEALERMLALKNQSPSTPSVPSVSSAPIVPGPSASVPNSVATKRPLATNQAVPAKKPLLERSVWSSIGNTFSSIEIPVDNDTDLLRVSSSCERRDWWIDCGPTR